MTSLKRELLSGVFWIAVAKYSGLLTSVVISAILARNISPAAFGTIAVASVIMAFLDIFINLGIGPAIIQFKNLTKHQINSLFVLGFGIGIVLASMMFLSSSVIANFYDDPVLSDIVKLLSICLIFNALNIVPGNLMLKEKRFKVVALRTLFFQILCGCLAVAAALDGYGVYALLISPILSSIGIFAVNYFNYPQKFTLNIDWSAIKIVGKYSSFQFLFTLSNYFSRNIDTLIIGKYFSMAELGYYDKSYRLMQLPLQNITFVISPVLHPILSSLQDDKELLGEKNVRLTALLSNISFPLGILLYFCAPEIIKIIFGSQWDNSIPVFEILALSVPLQVILSTSGAMFQASGKTDHLFYSGIINTISTVIGFLTAAIWFKTITSMAWAWDITLLINFCNTYVIMNKYTFSASLVSFLKSFLPQITNTLIVVVVSYLMFRFYIPDNIMIALIYKAGIICIATFIIAFLLKQYNIIKIIIELRNRSWK